MSSETRPPLWRVLKEAYEAEDIAECDRHPDAAMIGALADWIERHCSDFANLSTDPIGDVVTALRHEADRAKKGE